MENKHNFMGIIITVIVAVILLTALPILTNMSTDCPDYNIGHLDINPDFSSGDYNVDKGSYDYIESATIIKDENLIPENIKKGVNIFGVVGTYEETGGVPLEQFMEFPTDYSGDMYGYRLLTFQSTNPFGSHTPFDIKIYYKISIYGSDEDVLLVSKRVDSDSINFIVIPRSYGNLKIVMSLVPDAEYGWTGFSGFYAKTAQPNVVTQLTVPSWEDDFVLSYVDFDVFHVVFTAYGD